MLEDLKDYLKITWDDEDNALDGIIEAGQAHIDYMCGETIDYDTDKQAKALLLDYCRYRYNMASEEFETNFAKPILNLQMKYAIKDMEVMP